MDTNNRWVQVLSHRERLLRLAYARLPRTEDAEDVVQEALIRAATFPDLDEQRLGEFLTSVTVRLCVDEWRRAARASGLARRVPVDRFEEPGVDEHVCAQAEAAWAAALVASLPATQQEILHARAEGLSYEEIGRRRRLSFKAVESAAARARATVRRALVATLSALWLARRHVGTTALVAVTACGALALGSRSAVHVSPLPEKTSPVSHPSPRLAPAVIRSSTPTPAPRVTSPSAHPSTSTNVPRKPVVTLSKPAVPSQKVPGGEATTGTKLERCVEDGLAPQHVVRCVEERGGGGVGV